MCWLVHQNCILFESYITLLTLYTFFPSPRLPFSIFLTHTALQLCREVERQSLANLHIIGSKLSECAQTAVYRLSDRKEGDPKLGAVKYR